MATRFEAVLWGASEERLRAAGEEALAEIQRCEALLSRFLPGSDIYEVNARAADQFVRVDPRVLALLDRVRVLHDASHGAFDITVGPLRRAWGFDGATGSVPAPEALERARAVVGMNLIELAAAYMSVRFLKPGVELDLGAIGKGYAVERAAEVIREAGVPGALIHGGTSTVQAIGHAPDGNPWRVGVRHPNDPSDTVGVAYLEECALSVSAPHGKAFRADGRQYGHVLDPRRGCPVEGALLAAVRCPSATDSDALSTALLVLGEAFAEELADGPFNAACLLCVGADELERVVATAW
ncbi:MAG: FAD:protein FMN transferase [Chthonomonadales bacterium]